MTPRVITVLAVALAALPTPASAQSAEQIAQYEERIAEQQRQLDEMRAELDALKATVDANTAKEAAATATETSKMPAEAESKLVFRKNENLSLQLSGRLHRMIMNVDDGADTTALFTDSEQGPTMLRFDATGKVNDGLTVGATIETGIRQNRPFQVSQDNTSAGTSVNVRIAEAFINSTRFGKLSLGRGFGASWLAPEMDLSGTQFASLLPVGMLAPGLKFVDASDNSLSDIQVLDHFVDVERLLLVDRVRYDSPQFGPNLQLSSSLAADSRWDVALRAKPKASDSWTFVGGASYQHEPFLDIKSRQDAVVSMRHNASGLNLTVGAVREELDSGRDANTYIVKAGWLTDLVSLGKTAFSIDFYKVEDLRLSGDQADSIGLFAVQKWPTYGIDFYGGYRFYDVDRSDVDLKKLNLFALGVALNS